MEDKIQFESKVSRYVKPQNEGEKGMGFECTDGFVRRGERSNLRYGKERKWEVLGKSYLADGRRMQPLGELCVDGLL